MCPKGKLKLQLGNKCSQLPQITASQTFTSTFPHLDDEPFDSLTSHAVVIYENIEVVLYIIRKIVDLEIFKISI